jgi:FKBP-type peptidyl-prolyl cis-trans isomerase SlyD
MKARVISFNCVLRDPLGRVISSSFNHDVLTQSRDRRVKFKAPSLTLPSLSVQQAPQPSHFDFHEPLQGLVEGLQGLKKGERRQIFVSAERAYGFYDPDLVMQVSRRKFPQGDALEIGFQVVTQAKDGECRVFRVIDADPATVTLDGNHPLAGQDLCFDIEATATREATAEELALKQAKPTAVNSQFH